MIEGKDLTFGHDVRVKLLAGAEKVANAVGATIGAKGRNVIIEKGVGTFESTNDGVTVARSLFFPDAIEGMAAHAVKEATTQTEEEAGDGTSGCAILTHAILSEGMKHLSNGANPMDLKRGIAKAAKQVCSIIDLKATDIKGSQKDILSVATVSANNDPEIGALIAQAVVEVGPYGIITTEDSIDGETTLFTRTGIEFGRGFTSPYYKQAQDMEKEEIELTDAYVLLCSDRIQDPFDLKPIMDQLYKEQPGSTVLVISDDISEAVLRVFLANSSAGTVRIVHVRQPEFGDTRMDAMQDIATVTAGTVVGANSKVQLKTMSLDDLGQCEKILVGRDSTILAGGYGEDASVEARAELIRTQLLTEKEAFVRGKLEARLSCLVGGIATIRIFAPTESEMQDKRRRIDDAISATKAAIAEGIVPGGGVTLMYAASEVDPSYALNDDECKGMSCVTMSLITPFNKIISNSGLTPQVIFAKLIEEANPSFGYNLNTNEIVNMQEAGIIDPAKVVKSALTNAASAAAMLLITEVAVTDVERKFKLD